MVAAMAGELGAGSWYRDFVAGGSNFSMGYSLMLQ
jgi:hypothetical protein